MNQKISKPSSIDLGDGFFCAALYFVYIWELPILHFYLKPNILRLYFTIMRQLLFAFLLLCLPLASQAQDTLKLLTWNIQMLPNGFRWFSSSLRKLQMVRLPWVAEYVNHGEYDVIVFQEVFDAQARRRLRRALKKNYP